MKKSLLLMALLYCQVFAFSGCAKDEKDPRDIRITNEEFLPYIKKFETEWGKSVGDIPIGFKDINDGDTIGICWTWQGENTYHQIEIDEKWWKDPNTNENNKINLIFHELGHCALNLDHNDNVHSLGGLPLAPMVPDSFMNEEVFFGDEPSESYEYYVDELFNRN